MRSRRTPRLPAPRALSMGILKMILHASLVNLAPPSSRVPHPLASFAKKVGDENLDERTAFTSETG
jgi:hypothetical protein